MPKALKYNYCPFCFGNIQLVKAPHRRHVWQCPNCGFTIAPNWRKGRFEPTAVEFKPDIEKWAKEGVE
jgi:ribosomal protein L37AE/L43A